MSPLSMIVEIWNWAFLFSRKALGGAFLYDTAPNKSAS